MAISILKKDNSVDVNQAIVSFYAPKFCFYKIDKECKIIKKVGEYVNKCEVIMTKNKINIYSTISGIVNSITDKYIQIENDYKEHKKHRCGLNKIKVDYNKTELIDILSKHGMILAKTIINKNPHRIVVNALVCEPYDFTNIFLLREKTMMILETMNCILNTFNCEKGILVLSSNYGVILNRVLDNMGIFPKIQIKICSPLYPLNNNTVLKKILGIKRNRSNLFISLFDIYKIGYILKHNENLNEKYFVIAGETKPIVINCKIGTQLSELLKELKINNGKDYILNGYMHGEIITQDDYYINDQTDLIIVDQLKEEKEKECINCGLCNDNCPLNLHPKMILKKNYNKCINCGICNYLCPSNVDLLGRRS